MATRSIANMFKKKPQVKSAANIKSSERRHLLSEIYAQFGIDKTALTKEQELALLPATTKQASYHSVQDHKGTIYFNDHEKPIWFRVRDSPLYPTLYTLWDAAYLLPVILTNSHVLERIEGNANLMLPGCLAPMDKRAVRGALVGVACYKTPSVVMAIGTCALNLTQFDDTVGRQGTAVLITHRINDELFNLYDGDVQVPAECSIERPVAQESSETTEAETAEPETAEHSGEAVSDNTSLQGTDADEDAGDTIDTPAEEPTDDPVDELAETVETLSTDDLDNFFIRAFLQAVKTSEIVPPVSASKFMSDFILSNFPKMDPKLCNIKKTSWRKTSKYLKALEKLKYLQLKGKGDDVSVVAITVPPETLSLFVTHKTMPSAKAKTSDLHNASADKMTVVHFYKPTNKARMIYNKLDLNYNAFYTAPELKLQLNDYIKLEKLPNPKNPKLVNPDDALVSATNLPKEPVRREQLFPAFLKTFSPHYAILGPGQTLESDFAIKKGEPKKIKILTQTVLGRKKTTTVTDFEQFHLKPQPLADDLKHKCSGSTAIGPSKHNPAVTEIMVQGPHGLIIIEYLQSKGIPSSFIDFEDKSKSKKKR